MRELAFSLIIFVQLFAVSFFLLGNIVLYSSGQQSICKFTVKGTEYVGHSKETKSKKFCQKWDSSEPHQVSPDITDYNFPDGSKKAAKNYCRNPDNSENGPWCYTINAATVQESCNLPLCSFNSCQLTGLGMEYSGHKQVTIKQNECMSWSLSKPSGKGSTFDLGFPDGNRMLAHKYCRNPTGDPVGPWCYVANVGFESGLSNEYTKEYCDIPSCFDREDIFIVNRNTDPYYTHFSTMKTDGYALNISILLWQVDKWKDAKLKLALTVLPIPGYGNLYRKWDIGFEVIITNDKTGPTSREGEEETWEAAPTILKGTGWVNLTLEWSKGFILMKYLGSKDHIFLHEYSEDANSILGISEWKTTYYSIIGSPAFINLYGTEEVCEEHITFSTNYVRYFAIRYDKLTKVLDFHVRAGSTCVLVLMQSPVSRLPPELVITLDGVDNQNSVALKWYNEADQILSSISMPNIVSYWSWASFTISIVSTRLVMYMKKKTGIHPIFDVTDDNISTLTWFTIGSDLTAHWTLYCPPDEYKIPEPLLPECSISRTDIEYEGHQWVTHSFKPCIPWIDESIKEKAFDHGSSEKSMNYCRNPTIAPDGTYCFAYNLPHDWSIIHEHCFINKCRLKDCRIAGTATDYAGSLDKTVSNKTCQSWTADSPHDIPEIFRANDGFPEREVSKAKNFCRNPNGDISGTWCYTVDPKMIFDLCNVPDCVYSEECTILVQHFPKRKIYILPNWRIHGLNFRVKIWDPAKVSGVVIFLESAEGTEAYRLEIGSKSNENISLHYYDSSGKNLVLKHLRLYHILSSGRWTGFNLKFSEEKISLFYENAPKAFFHFKFSDDLTFTPFNPVFMSYASSSFGFLGFNFECNESQTLISGFEDFPSVFYPVPLWLPEKGPLLEELTLHFKASETFLINLSTLPTLGPDIKVIINGGEFHDEITSLVKFERRYHTIAINRLDNPVVDTKYWTEIKFIMKEDEISIMRNGTIVSKWKNLRAMRIYFFCILPQKEVTWIANSQPPDLNSPLRHGGWAHWSSWNCTVTCGGGKGIRYRTCTNPMPSIFGKPCTGPSEEIGHCNSFSCGEMTPDLHEVINYRLRRYLYNLRVQYLHNLQLHCYKDILTVLKEEAPHYVFYWIHNGIRITPLVEMQSLNIENSSLSLTLVKFNDSGVYACVVRNNSTVTKILQITALTVTSDSFSETIREGKKYFLRCNNRVLDHMYGHLLQSWLFNGKIWKAYEKSQILLVDDLEIPSIKRNMTGVWECNVYQDELNLTWVTNWIRLRVLPRATFITHVLEDTSLGLWISSEQVFIIILISFFLLITVTTAVFTFFIIYLQKSFQRKAVKRGGKYSKVEQDENKSTDGS